VLTDAQIRIARPSDAQAIAEMSRDLIEHGLGWRWTPSRIRAALQDREINVAVAWEGHVLAGFGVMKYRDDEAELFLLAVRPTHRRKGIGRALVVWLEEAALTAGLGVVYLEARKSNRGARSFYRALEYSEVQKVCGRYLGVEDGIRLAKDLWAKG
jgi:ribosomal protein S18 acetylase RimI-like enzyme